MNDKKKKLEILDYAIKRINQYSDFDNDYNTICIIAVIPECTMCELVDNDCSVCPFNYKSYRRFGCRPMNFSEYTVKEHQDSLIKSTKKWCKKNKLKYTIGIVR